MTIAYVLGKFDEHMSDFSWVEVIEGGLFEYLERLTITDLKPQIFERIKANEQTLNELKNEVYTRFKPLIADLYGLDDRFEAYLSNPKNTASTPVLDASDFYATKWEFDIIERENENDYEIGGIRRGLQKRQEALSDVEGLRRLDLFPTYRSIVDLCGRLRFQVRWGNSTGSRERQFLVTCSSLRWFRTCSRSRSAHVQSVASTTTSLDCSTTCPKFSRKISSVPSKGLQWGWIVSLRI